MPRKYAAKYLDVFNQSRQRIEVGDDTDPAVEGSMTIFPAMTTGQRAVVRRTTVIGVRGVLGKRTRLNFSASNDIGNSAMTVSHTSENLSR